MPRVITREERGKMIAEKPNQIVRQSKRRYGVVSQSSRGTYTVSRTKTIPLGWICTCPDFTYRSVKCKHIWAVEFSAKLREIVKPRVIEPIDVHVCLYCKSDRLIKWGIRHNRYGDIQKFSCKACGRYFTVNLGFERMKHDPQGITAAMQLYFSGESLRNTAKSETDRGQGDSSNGLQLDSEVRGSDGQVSRPDQAASQRYLACG